VTLPIEVMTGAVRGGTSILYAAIGESISETAGVVNLGTEGSMLVGALAGYAVTANTGNPWVGVAAGAAAGGALALVHAFFVLHRRSNQLAVGSPLLPEVCERNRLCSSTSSASSARPAFCTSDLVRIGNCDSQSPGSRLIRSIRSLR